MLPWAVVNREDFFIFLYSARGLLLGLKAVSPNGDIVVFVLDTTPGR
jgi:hypothetical protein